MHEIYLETPPFSILSPGQTIATGQLNISQHCWPSICKSQPNDHNILTQRIATLLGATCCHRLVTMLGRVATCCKLKIELVRMPMCNIAGQTTTTSYNIHKCCVKNLTIFKFEPKAPNMSQNSATRRNVVAKRTQHVTLRPTMLRYVALKCCDRLAGV